MDLCCLPLAQTPDEDAALKAIKLAFDNGVNFFDVAPFYAAGKAEEVQPQIVHAAASMQGRAMGDATQRFTGLQLHKCRLHFFSQLLGRGLAQLPRDQIVVATKVGKYKPGEPEDFSAERVKRSVHESLDRLGEAVAACGCGVRCNLVFSSLQINGYDRWNASTNRSQVHRLDTLPRY